MDVKPSERPSQKPPIISATRGTRHLFLTCDTFLMHFWTMHELNLAINYARKNSWRWMRTRFDVFCTIMIKTCGCENRVSKSKNQIQLCNQIRHFFKIIRRYLWINTHWHEILPAGWRQPGSSGIRRRYASRHQSTARELSLHFLDASQGSENDDDKKNNDNW